MNIYAIASLSASLIIAILGLFVLYHNPKNSINRIFFYSCSVIGLWIFGCFLESYILDKNLIFIIDKFANVFAVLSPALFIHTIYTIIGKKDQKIIIGAYLSSLFLAASIFSPYFSSGIAYRYNVRYLSVPGPLYFLFILLLTVCGWFSFINTFQVYRISSGHKRAQAKYLLLAIAVIVIAAISYFMLVFNIQIPPLDNYLNIVYGLIMTYAILYHRLMDIELVIKRTAVYSILTALITGVFLVIVVTSNYFAINISGNNSLIIGLITAFILAIALQPLRDATQQLVDRTFFRTRYDYQNIINKYSKSLSRPMTDLTRFSKVTPYLLWKSMKLAGASFMVLNREAKSYKIRAGNGKASTLVGLSIPEDAAIIRELTRTKTELNYDDIVTNLKSNENLSPSEREKLDGIRRDMELLKSTLIIPCISESEYFNKPTLLSTINLGKKLSDESFSAQDIDFLKTLANQAAISIEYAFILEELKKNQNMVLQSEKLASLGTITAGIAHELKNPLTYIITASQILVSKWNDPEFRQSALTLLPAEAERMRIIVEGILGFSRNKELSLEPVEIKEVIKKVLALLSYELKKNHIELKEEFNHAIKVNGDQNRLIQVFMNLINNAIQAIGEKGGIVTISTRDTDDVTEINIADSGPGIPKDKLQKIFEPFYTTKESGTGLGLAIIKKYVDEHHGEVKVASEPGRGTVFTVLLPHFKLV